MIEVLRIEDGRLLTWKDMGGYAVLLYPFSGHPRFSGGHLRTSVYPKNYSELIPLPKLKPNPRGRGLPVKWTPNPLAVKLKAHDYFKVEQFFFEAGWDWGMNGFLEGCSRELTHKGRYQE